MSKGSDICHYRGYTVRCISVPIPGEPHRECVYGTTPEQAEGHAMRVADKMIQGMMDRHNTGATNYVHTNVQEGVQDRWDSLHTNSNGC